MTGEDTALRRCAESYCDRPVWPIDREYCVLHSRLVDKPSFWEEVLRDQNPVARSAFDAPEFDLSRDPPPDTPKGREFTIELDGLRFPGGKIPDWLLRYNLAIGYSHFNGHARIVGLNDRRLSLFFVESHGPFLMRGGLIGAGSFFTNCRFEGLVGVEECSFTDPVFSDTTFFGPVRLVSLDIGLSLRFRHSVFENSLEFQDLKGSRIPPFTIVFDDVQFAATDFGVANLERFEFHGCRWKRMGPWWDRRIRSVTERAALSGQRQEEGPYAVDPQDRALESASVSEEQFRQMRRVFTRAGNAELANEFHLSELESLRLRLKSSRFWKPALAYLGECLSDMLWRLRLGARGIRAWGRNASPTVAFLFSERASHRRDLRRAVRLKGMGYWALSVHKWLSYYNIRYLRPLFWLVILVVSLTVFHRYGGFDVRTSDKSSERGGWVEALNFSVSSMMIRSGGEYVPTSTVSRIARTAGQVFGPGLVLVFAFSMRRRYKVPSGLD